MPICIVRSTRTCQHLASRSNSAGVVYRANADHVQGLWKRRRDSSAGPFPKRHRKSRVRLELQLVASGASSMMPGEESLSPSGHFEYHNRPRHDIFWGILYACALALTVVGGLYASVHRYDRQDTLHNATTRVCSSALVKSNLPPLQNAICMFTVYKQNLKRGICL